jgi:hypothetical protein
MSHTIDSASTHDVMQVCRNGHVITDLLLGYPERGLFHCDRCGAQTLDRCPTCGEHIPGAIHVPGLPPAGSRPAPNYCSTCGAAFPWTIRPRLPQANPRSQLESLLRRLPQVVRQLRWRQTERPPLRVEEERDLEDVVRAFLPLLFDDVRLEKRTPRYAPGSRTDFLLSAESIVLAVKLAGTDARASEIAGEVREDAAYYAGRMGWHSLMVLVYDPEGMLREPAALERAWSSQEGELAVRCIIAV